MQTNSVSGTLSQADFLAAQRLHRSSINRWSLLALLIMLGMGGLLLTLQSGRMLAPLLLGGGIGGLIGMGLLNLLILPRRVARLHRQMKALADATTTHWDEDHLEARSAKGYSSMKWVDFVRFRENKQLFLLYVADNLFYIFPKRWFSDAAQMESFRQLARQAGKS